MRPSARATRSSGEPDEVRQPRQHSLALVAVHRGAAHEERRELARREGLGRPAHLLGRCVAREHARAAVVRGRERHRRQGVDPAEDVVVRRVERADLEGGGDEDRPVEADPGSLLQHSHEASDAVAAVALAGDEDRRAPPAVCGQPAPHELRERLEVALLPEVLLRVDALVLVVARVPVGGLVLLLALDHAAEAGADRVDEHEVGEREPGRLVLHQPGRHLGERSVRGERDAQRPDRAEMQVRRRGAGAAVEHERHRPPLVRVCDVRDGEDLRGGLVLLAQDDPARRRRIRERRRAAGPRRARLRPGGRLVVAGRRLRLRRVVVHRADATRVDRRPG